MSAATIIQLCRELSKARAEIERLEGENSILRRMEATSFVAVEEAEAVLAAERAEIERLQEQLISLKRAWKSAQDRAEAAEAMLGRIETQGDHRCESNGEGRCKHCGAEEPPPWPKIERLEEL